MSLHEQIAARFTEQDTKILLLTLADHIERLEAEVEQLKKFLPHHLPAPTAPKLDVVATKATTQYDISVL
jgi:hypothetical protein